MKVVLLVDEWGKQMEEMLAEMTTQLKALGYIKQLFIVH